MSLFWYNAVIYFVHVLTLVINIFVIFFIFGPYVFKKIGEWFTIGASIGGLKVLQKINNSKEVKGEKHEKED